MTSALTFEPIAIIGQGCVLPGALSPEALWEAVARGDDLTSGAPEGDWLMPPEDALTDRTTPAEAIDRAWSDRGGHVRGFEDVFDPRGFAVDADTIRQLDPLFQWSLHAAREALVSAGMDPTVPHERAGVVLGNLSYPTQSLARLAEATWAHDASKPHPLNRFMSGMPAHLTAQALRLGGRAFALDAACASSLYAIKAACDLLHQREADVMLAGGANHADDLFLHVGFSALSALSKTGRSRPFHSQADGLLPAEGAGYLVLKRLSDALDAGDNVLGVIRGVGLSNDGRGRGLLTPSHEGQVRCMRAAYAMSGIDPSEVSLIECHATGTPLGDGTELGSIAEVFARAPDLPVGSLKSNMGHLITASGMGGVMKVLAAFAHDVRPATIGASDAPVATPDGSPLRILHKAEPWPARPHRIAGLNNFGFGGNNAHLILEAFDPARHRALAAQTITPAPHADATIAVIGLSVRAAGAEDAEAFTRDLFAHTSHIQPATDDAPARALAGPIELDVAAVRFPPNDLKHTLAQQLMLLQAAFEIEPIIARQDHARTGSLVGMQCDAEVARYGARWRLGERDGAGDLTNRKNSIVAGLNAAGVIGAMPNIVANRLGSQLDLLAPSYTISSEEVSGNVALELAMSALRRGELDCALVGAVDMSCEPVQEGAIAAVAPERGPAGDAAVLLVLKRLDDARRDGDEVLATVHHTRDAAGEPAWTIGGAHDASLAPLFGHAHTASGLLHVAAAVQAVHHRARPGFAPRQGSARPWLPGETPRAVRVDVRALGGQRHALDVRVVPGARTRPLPDQRVPLLRVFGAPTRRELLLALSAGEPTEATTAPYRVVIVADDSDDLKQKRAQAAALFEQWAVVPGAHRLGPGIWAGHGELAGEVAAVFTGPAGSYADMGRALMLALPHLAEDLHARFDNMGDVLGWIYDEATDVDALTPLQKLWGSSFMCQLHAELTRSLLKIPFTAAVGFCSGETNALFAMGAWEDLGAMYRDVEASGIFDRALGGQFEAVQAAWRTDEIQWANWRLKAPVEAVRRATEREPRAHLTIINAPGDVVIAGDAAACQRVIDAVRPQHARELGYNLAMHCPEARGFTEAWRALHHRPTRTLPDVRFYTHATIGAYLSDADACADMLTQQAMHRVDFPALVRRAWDDGVRVFIEHGPHAGCTRWIGQILGDRPHVAIALDEGPQTSAHTIARALAQAIAAGVPMRHADLHARLHPEPPAAAPAGRRVMKLSFPAHPPTIAPEIMGAPRTGDSCMASNHTPAPSSLAMRPAPRVPSSLSSAPPTLRRPASAAPVATTPAVHSAAPAQGSVVASPAPAPAPSPVAPVVAAPTPQPVTTPAPAPIAAPTLVTTPQAGHSFYDALAAHTERLSAMHEDFLRQQSDLQAQFLNMRQVAEHELLRALGASPQAFAPGAAAVHASAPVITHQPAPAPVVHQQPVATPAPAPVAPVAASTPAVAAAPAAAAIATLSALQTPAKPAPVAPQPKPAPAAHQQRPSVAKPVTTTSSASPYTIDHTGMRICHTPQPVGPSFDKAQLAIHAEGKISEIYGPLFAQQDDFHWQVRMPAGKLLLADRVLGIDAEPGVVGKGTLWTESDVEPDAWYLHQGHVPAGIMIESGQADLMLISWMGADFENKGERIYRLLGCDLTYTGGMPRPGDTLRYDIHVDGHARQGGQRLFFFHYDCCIGDDVRLRVRNGQAGFFTMEEMDDSKGVLWSPEEDETLEANPRLDGPHVPAEAIPTSLDRDQLVAISEGRIYETLGSAYFRAAPHTASPTIEGKELMLFDRVTHLQLDGGPWGRGYLRAELDIVPDQWFFDGHFHNDPCMPGTIMYDASLQTMSLYMIAMGYTLEKDGWVFEPVPDETYRLRCRGQVGPTNKKLVYEMFVREVIDGPEPTLWADLLCTVDGLKAFHCARMGYKLSPDWPLDRMPELLDGYVEAKPVAVVDGFKFGYDSLLACAWGKPSRAFGPMYERFDSPTRVARLPSPPYHFLTRVTDVTGPIGVMKTGATVDLEYDVPVGEWYFDQNGCRVMPYAVLLEAGLQPCGWLASYIGCALSRDEELFFRNLDGTATQHVEITERTGTLRTEVKLTSLSRAGSMIIVGFAVEMFAGDVLVYDMTTVFGFFPAEALANQVGLDINDAQRERACGPHNTLIDLTQRPARFFGELGAGLTLPDPMLLMLDRVVVLDPTAGEAGLGRIRGEKDVDPAEWFFKAHFFQDPVQPGSLGIEALLQLLQAFMLHQGIGADVPNGRFEAIAIDKPMTWKYRGQVVPRNKLITSELEIVEIGRDERGPFVIAEGSLWVDGKRIYSVKNMGMRVTHTPAPTRATETIEADADDPDPAGPTASAAQSVQANPSVTLSLATAPWLADHRPTYTRPALPMMSAMDLLAQFARAAHPTLGVVGAREVKVTEWIIVGDEDQVRCDAEVGPMSAAGEVEVVLYASRNGAPHAVAATGTIALADAWPEPPDAPPVALNTQPVADPYASGALFHGPAFQILREVRERSGGAIGWLDASTDAVPAGEIAPLLLDGALHVIPHEDLARWDDRLLADHVAYPHVIERLTLHGPVPREGMVRVDARIVDASNARLPRLHLQLALESGEVWADLLMTEVLLPKGKLGSLPGPERRAFLRDGVFVEGAGLSTVEQPGALDEATVLSMPEVRASDWFPGTMQRVYRTRHTTLPEQTLEIAVKEHVSRSCARHPSRVAVYDDASAVADVFPLTRFHQRVEQPKPTSVRVSTAAAPRLDISLLVDYWRQAIGAPEGWLGEDLYGELMRRYVRGVVVEDPDQLASLRGRSVLFLGNHEVQIESLLITSIASWLSQTTVITMANAKHEQGWVGTLIRHLFSAPGVEDPNNIIYFNQQDHASMMDHIAHFKGEVARRGASVMVHAAGTRQRSVTERTERLGSLFLDMAVELGLPIVPVRFVGGLPVEPVSEDKLEFPFMQTAQDYYIGRAIMPETLGAMPYAERKRAVLGAINGLGPAPETCAANPPDAAHQQRIDAWRARTGASEVDATLLCALDAAPALGPHGAALVAGARAGALEVPNTQEGRWLADLARRLYGPNGPRVSLI